MNGDFFYYLLEHLTCTYKKKKIFLKYFSDSGRHFVWSDIKGPILIGSQKGCEVVVGRCCRFRLVTLQTLVLKLFVHVNIVNSFHSEADLAIIKVHRWLRGNDISSGTVTGCCLWSLGNLRQHTELHYVGWTKIKTNWTQTDVITP